MLRPNIEAAIARAEEASPPPWTCEAQQPSVVVYHSDDRTKRVADIDTWSGRGVFDGDFMAKARVDVPEIGAWALELETALRTLDKWHNLQGYCLECGHKHGGHHDDCIIAGALSKAAQVPR